MNTQNTINKIKERGHWVIHIHPLQFKEDVIGSRTKVKEVVRNAIVQLRGWDYPHFSDSEGEPVIVDNGIQKEVSLEGHIEFWRMTQSANFLHLRALKEDSLTDVEYQNMWARGDELKGKKILGVLNTLCTLVEIFEFTKRLIKQGIYQDAVVIDIELHNIYDRHLYVDASRRIPFSQPRVSHSQNPWKWKVELQINEVLNNLEKYVLEAFLDLVDLFGWDNPPVDVYKDDIQKFLEGKL